MKETKTKTDSTMTGSLSRRTLLRGAASLGALGAFGAGPALGADIPATGLKKGAVIVFQGDSVTDSGRDKNSLLANDNKALGRGYPALAAGELLEAYPDLGLRIFNRGVSGNKVPDLAARWQEDAIDLKPDILSILVGINDLWHTVAFGSKYKGTVEDYEQGYRDLLLRSRKEIPGVRLIVCEPFTLRDWPAFDPYRAVAKKLAEELNLTFVPFQETFDNAAKAAPAEFWLWDGIHPTTAGYAVMLRAWRKAVGV